MLNVISSCEEEIPRNFLAFYYLSKFVHIIERKQNIPNLRETYFSYRFTKKDDFLDVLLIFH